MGYISPEEAVKLYEKYGSIRRAARKTGIPRTTFRRRLAAAKTTTDSSYLEAVKQQRVIEELRKKLKAAELDRLTASEVKKYIIKLKDHITDTPDWVTEDSTDTDLITGIPSVMLSDFHWSEVVDPEQVFGKNEYRLEIAEKRLRYVIDRIITVLTKTLAVNEYPGIVVNLAGDLISGDIHDELTATNEKPIMPTFLHLYENLIAAVEKLANVFGNVFIPCVHGNHSRNTKKVQAKDQAYTNFDWLLYHMLAKYFEDNDNVKFLIADGADVQYKVYNHVYRLTHGNQFRGGNGTIGFIYPVARGHMKKQTAAVSYDHEYDTLLIGHFHQYMTLGNVIVNGSLVGYNEYALSNNYPFDLPKQALWITNKKYGITLNTPIIASDVECDRSTSWVSVFDKKI